MNNNLVSLKRRKVTGFKLACWLKEKYLFGDIYLNYPTGSAKVRACNRVFVEFKRGNKN